MEFGVTWRTFRKKRGGLAPIGKFYDLGVTYAHNEYHPGSDNPSAASLMLNNEYLNQVVFHVGVGTQMVFWDRVVANTGVRLAGPIMVISSASETSFLERRAFEKDIFQVFFGVGILL
jgi:hypothetical protein